jgi:hypothetical protein
VTVKATMRQRKSRMSGPPRALVDAPLNGFPIPCAVYRITTVPEGENQAQAWRKSWRGKLPSARIHHICRPDMERDEHSHPWDARTFVLRNWYHEVRGNRFFIRKAGDTATLRYGEFHRITTVPEGGVWTLFITWPKQGSWGFKVGDKVVPWREYLNEV